MRHRPVPAWLLPAVLASAALAADLPQQWRAWLYSRTISGPQTVSRVPAELRLPWEVLAKCTADCADLRIIEENGKETAYKLEAEGGESKTEFLHSEIVERSFVPRQFTQVVVKVASGDANPALPSSSVKRQTIEPWFNTIRLETPETDFMYWVETSVSDDAHEWRIVDPRSPISRFQQKNLAGNQTIHFSGSSNQRYLRLRIFAAERQFAVSGVEVLFDSSSLLSRSAIPAALSAEGSPDPSESRWRAELPSQNLPVSEILLATSTPEFYRAVRISTSADAKDWLYRASGAIYRYDLGGIRKESLGIAFPEISGARFWRIEIVNGNDPPLADTVIVLRGIPRKILFREEPRTRYFLLYGNVRARAPRYDLEHYLDVGNVKPAFFLPTLGEEQRTANYLDPRPYTERHPVLLWLALGVAVLLLGYTALRMLRSAPPAR